MTTPDEPLPVRQHVTGDGNLMVGGSVSGDILQVFGDGRGFRELIVRDEVAPDHVAWLTERFAQPDGFAHALELLDDDERVVLLDGEPRTGRWTTAVCLLASAANEPRTTINLIEYDEETDLSLRRIASGANVLLDLTGFEASIRENKLRTFLGTIADAQARLVVLLSGRETDDIRVSFQGRIRRVGMASAVAVVRRHLQAEELPAEPVIGVPGVRELLSGARAADGARFAGLVCAEHRAQSAAMPLADVVGRAVAAYSNWSQDLIHTFDDGPDARRRSLLLTVALLNGGSTETLYWAERMLLKLVRYSQEEGNPLNGRGFVGRLSELGRVRLVEDRTMFDRREYDRSVLTHVWRGYPEMRDTLVEWVVVLGSRRGRGQLTEVEAAGMIRRFIDLCAVHDVGKHISQVAKKWARMGGHTARWAVRLLTEGALDPRVGRLVHRKLNEWASHAELPPELAAVVREVCVSEFGRAHTQKALTRLGNLAGYNNDGAVGETVVAAVRSLVADYDALPQALIKLVEWLGGDRKRHKVIAVRMLGALTNPDGGVLRLSDLASGGRHGIRSLLLRIWQDVLAMPDVTVITPAVSSWLDRALEPAWREPILGVLVEAATAPADQGGVTRIGSLTLIAKAWVGVAPRYWPPTGDDEARMEVYRQVIDRVDAVHPLQLRTDRNGDR